MYQQNLQPGIQFAGQSNFPPSSVSHTPALHPAALHTQPQSHLHQGQPSAQYQRLKVEDALSYLDQVKLQFGNQPSIYNEFLDIMKEFKSQTIDTPGVIQRVSNLFKGHPDLIVGFNTFLPPGYKIEAQSDTINVHQPGQQVMSLSSLELAQQYRTQQMAASAQGLPQQPTSTPGATNYRPDPASVDTKPPNFGATAAPATGQSQSSQPVEFNHAISYVNKIKHRFQNKPEVYKQFLEILHTYQKEQRNIKEGAIPGTVKPLTETEVYSQVQLLFAEQSDLLSEFGQFLPDATGHSGYLGSLSQAAAPEVASTLHGKDLASVSSSSSAGPSQKRLGYGSDKPSPAKAAGVSSVKRAAQKHTAAPPSKKTKGAALAVKEMGLAEVGKYGTLSEYAFFQKVRKVLRNQEVYDNFLRCLVLFNQNVITREDLVKMVQPFIGRHPELNRWFKDFVGYRDSGHESVPAGASTKDRMSEMAMHVDFATCKQYGVSYRALPNTYMQPKCSGRTALCHEVLNDTWVSFPSWSEDSSHVHNRKTNFEECLYRVEDERFELDMVIDLNRQTIHHFTALIQRMERMSYEDASRFQLDDNLGGQSEVLYRRAISRLYGDKAQDIIEGLKKNPCVAVPLVLRRLKSKETEWREHQVKFLKLWQEQNEKYYLKSLDHQGANFKQPDYKAMRSKALLNEIETAFDERQEQAPDNLMSLPAAEWPFLLEFSYPDRSILDDATNLIIHHVKRQTSLHKDDKTRIKQLLLHFLPDMFYHPRGQMSDEEEEEEEEEEIKQGKSSGSEEKDKEEKGKDKKEKEVKVKEESKIKEEPVDADKPSDKRESLRSSQKVATKASKKIKVEPREIQAGDEYTLFFGNGNWYVFFRLHHLLCSRLTAIYRQAVAISEEETKCKKERSESTAIALRMRQQTVDPDMYYPYFLDRVKDLLDGNMEAGVYEDTVRDLFGIHAYVTFTMDRLIQNIVRQLQHLVTDDVCIQASHLHLEDRERGGAGGLMATANSRISQEVAYQRKAENLLADENCHRITIYKQSCRITFELIDTENGETSEDTVQDVERWASYISDYITADENTTRKVIKRFADKPSFLARNIKSSKQEFYNKCRKNVQARRQQDVDLSQSPEAEKEPRSEDDETDEEYEGMLQDLQISDEAECKFSLNSFHLQFTAGRECIVFRLGALHRAKENHQAVLETKYKKYKAWLDDRVADVVTEAQNSATEDWFLGDVDGLKPCDTKAVSIQIPDRTPYHPYRKFRVTYGPVQE